MQRRTRACFRRRCWRHGRPVKRYAQFVKVSFTACAVLREQDHALMIRAVAFVSMPAPHPAATAMHAPLAMSFTLAHRQQDSLHPCAELSLLRSTRCLSRHSRSDSGSSARALTSLNHRMVCAGLAGCVAQDSGESERPGCAARLAAPRACLLLRGAPGVAFRLAAFCIFAFHLVALLAVSFSYLQRQYRWFWHHRPQNSCRQTEWRDTRLLAEWRTSVNVHCEWWPA